MVHVRRVRRGSIGAVLPAWTRCSCWGQYSRWGIVIALVFTLSGSKPALALGQKLGDGVEELAPLIELVIRPELMPKKFELATGINCLTERGNGPRSDVVHSDRIQSKAELNYACFPADDISVCAPPKAIHVHRNGFNWREGARHIKNCVWHSARRSNSGFRSDEYRSSHVGTTWAQNVVKSRFAILQAHGVYIMDRVNSSRGPVIRKVHRDFHSSRSPKNDAPNFWERRIHIRALSFDHGSFRDVRALLSSIRRAYSKQQGGESDRSLNKGEDRQQPAKVSDRFLRRDVPLLLIFIALGLFGAALGSRDRDVYRWCGYGLIAIAVWGIGAVAGGLL